VAGRARDGFSLKTGEKIMANYDQISEMLQKGKAKDVERLVGEALAEGAPAKEILEKGLIAGMAVIGGKFKNNQIFVPEVLMAARAMNKGMAIMEPAMLKAGINPLGTVVIGTVKGDLHDIGKNLVAMMFKGAGFKVVDLGVDVPPEKFAAAAKEHNACIVGLSALLTTTMPSMRDCVTAMKAVGLTSKIMIGGAPITQAFCNEIGADAYTPDAASAVESGKKLIGIS
jgi:5-methyltetrahydrofolate--homocysteine methyltransferase